MTKKQGEREGGSIEQLIGRCKSLQVACVKRCVCGGALPVCLCLREVEIDDWQAENAMQMN
jgi:hypothetical protein